MQRSSPTLITSSNRGPQPLNPGVRATLERTWRMAGTAFAFAFAGIAALFVAFVIVPPIHLLSRHRDVRTRRVQKVIQYACNVFVALLEGIGLFHFELHKTERLKEPGILVLANHPSLIDALVLLAQMPQAYCVVKRNFNRNPFFGPSAAAAGYIPSNDGAQMVDACVRHLREGRSVIIFPEGTRSPANGLGPFQRGAAHIAMRSGCVAVPVTIRSSPATLYRNHPWWAVPRQRPTFSVRVGQPFESVPSSQSSKSRARAARAYTASLHHYFERDLNVG